jgi:DNA-binding NarL/FixJ family response regulator
MNDTSKQLLYLADDHTIVANALSSLIQRIDSSMEIVIFSNGKQLYDACQTRRPDFVFLDIEMPVWDGRKTLSELKKDDPEIPCLILSMNSEKSIIQDCIQSGASAYLLKDASMDEFEEALRQVKNGKIYFSIEIMKVLSEPEREQKAASGLHQNIELSDREVDVLRLICEGLSAREIGEKLFVSPRTVETHKRNIMEKFDVNSVSKLIVAALKNEILK